MELGGEGEGMRNAILTDLGSACAYLDWIAVVWAVETMIEWVIELAIGREVCEVE